MSQRFPYIGAPLSGASPFYVMLTTPIAEKPCTPYAVSLAATAQTLTVVGVRFDIETLQGCCHVDDARNVLIRNFLQSDCTDLFFLDADLGWQPNAVLRLLKAPGDIVAGVYCHKSDEQTYALHPFEGQTETNAHGLFPMPKAATGFMRIRRAVLEALYEREKAKGRLLWLDGDHAGLNRLPVARICERGFVKELGLDHLGASEESQSGDYVLCLKARSLGFSVYVDPDWEFSHSGEKTWRGHFGNHTRRNQGIDPPKFEAAVAALPAPEAFEQLSANSLFDPHMGLPPEVLRECYKMARDARGDLLECGSGLSTLVMGLALKGSQHRLYALESDLAWVERVQTWLTRYGVENVSLIYAPLFPFPGGHWYSVEPADLPARFDGVVIDGPRRGDGVNRCAVLDVLRVQIMKARTWIIDDMDDERLARMVADWSDGRDIRTITAEAGGWRHDTAIVTLPGITMQHHDIRAGSREVAA
jgi:predicted O-methyltransferase YrrM